MTFGERLRYLRESRELRQQDVAEKVNISKRMIGYYESDSHFPRDAKMVVALADFFDVSLDYLFGLTDITKYENAEKYTEVIAACENLPKDKLNSVIDYINFLKSDK